jgi:hypothetical protein
MLDFLRLARAISILEHLDDLRIVLVSAVVTDKAEAKRLRQEIKRNEEDLERLLQEAPEGYGAILGG